MAAGPALISAVASVLNQEPLTAAQIKDLLPVPCTTRGVRYAVAHLIAQGRAQRRGSKTQGPVTAVVADLVQQVPQP